MSRVNRDSLRRLAKSPKLTLGCNEPIELHDAVLDVLAEADAQANSLEQDPDEDLNYSGDQD